jgi:hypothetical protein
MLYLQLFLFACLFFANDIQTWRLKIKTRSPAWQVFYFCFTDSSSPDLELFSDLASAKFLTTFKTGE